MCAKKRIALRALLSLMAIFVLALNVIHAQDNAESWTRFRGPNGTGILENFHAPIPWTKEQVRHRISLPGTGNGSPSIWNDVAFLQTSDADAQIRSLVAIDLNAGKIVWKRDTAFVPYSIHKYSSYASCTPCVDADRVYNVWGSPQALVVEAYDHKGEQAWSRDLGKYVSQHGFGSSPMRVGDLVVVFNSQDSKDLGPGDKPGTDRMVALNAATGETVWERELKPLNVCYGVPCIAEVDGKQALLDANSAIGFFALDASNGEVLFNHLPFSKRVCCSCVFNDQIIVSSEGSGGGGNVVVAMDRATGKERFRVDKAASYVPSALIYKNQLIIWSDNGIITSVDAYTGKTLATKRVGGSYSASPVVLGGMVANISHDGIVTVLDPSAKLNEVASIDLEQPSRATLAATPEKLLIRTDEQLWVIGK